MEPDYIAYAEADLNDAYGTADKDHATFKLARAQVYATLAVAQAVNRQTPSGAVLSDAERDELDAYRHEARRARGPS
jgi:hypothetical protein